MNVFALVLLILLAVALVVTVVVIVSITLTRPDDSSSSEEPVSAINWIRRRFSSSSVTYLNVPPATIPYTDDPLYDGLIGNPIASGPSYTLLPMLVADPSTVGVIGTPLFYNDGHTYSNLGPDADPPDPDDGDGPRGWGIRIPDFMDVQQLTMVRVNVIYAGGVGGTPQPVLSEGRRWCALGFDLKNPSPTPGVFLYQQRAIAVQCRPASGASQDTFDFVLPTAYNPSTQFYGLFTPDIAYRAYFTHDASVPINIGCQISVKQAGYYIP